MAHGAGEPVADLIARLEREYADFDFFQAVGLLEEYFLKKESNPDPIQTGHVRFAPDDAITFPPNDIARIEIEEGGVRLYCSFMGLCGASSPLPHYFSEYIAQHRDESNAVADFLAIFNHRLYTLFYRAWEKYRFVRIGLSPCLFRAVGALAGRPVASKPHSDDVRLRAYTGILAGRTRSAHGLEILIADFFGDIPVTVRQWMPRWVPLEEKRQLGLNTLLGANCVIGTHVYDISGKFRVVIGPLPRAKYETFLPGSENSARVKALIEEYGADPLAYDIEVQLQSMDLIPVVLGGTEAVLGATASLGRSTKKSGVHSVVISGR